jgi:hypothetical protein
MAGTAEFRSITVRGDVEATSLNAATGTFSGTLTSAAVNAVNTINIGVDQVTIPRFYYTASGSTATSSWATIQSGSVTVTAGTPVIVLGSAQFFNATNYIQYAYLQLLDPNGTVIAQGGMSGGTSVDLNTAFVIGYATVSGTYVLQASANPSGGGSVSVQNKALVLLAAKR